VSGFLRHGCAPDGGSFQCTPRFRVRKFDRTGTLGAIKPKLQRVGVLASPAVRLVGLYKSRMEESSFEALFPNLKDEAALLEVIRAVKAGRLDKKRRQKYAEIAGTLINAGAEAFLIACTELSVIGPLANTTVPAIDTLDALVEGTIRSARNFLNTTSPRRL